MVKLLQENSDFCIIWDSVTKSQGSLSGCLQIVKLPAQLHILLLYPKLFNLSNYY